MELVYLWVEDYKNIHKQGFNFSPKFNCDYDEKTNKLTIDENDHYIENFFGDNINVTAIVGKNGSGKSSLLSNIPIEYNTFLIFTINNQLFFYNFDESYSSIKYSKNILKVDDIEFDFFGLNYDFLVPDFIDDFDDYLYGKSTPLINNLLEPIFVVGNDKINLSKYRSIINKLIIKYSNVASIFNYNPSKIKFKQYYGFISEELKKLETSLRKEKILNTNGYDFLLEYKNNIKENFNSEYLLFYIFLKSFSKNKDSIELIKSLSNKSKINLMDIKEKIFNFIKKNNLNKLKILSNNFDIYINIFDKKDFFDKIKNISELKEDIGDDFELLLNEDILNIIDIDFFNDSDIEFIKLSQGERQIYTNMLLIYDEIQTNLNESILIQLDEPDLSLHPQWQKKYINELIKLLSSFSNKKFHILFTTHSPFLLSDIPKQNIIFLDKDEKGNCKVVDGLKDKKQTFGANIHTLLSDSFFMDDGLMGEFAKEKIDDLISYLNDEKSTIKDNDEAQKLLNMIGEPIIKNQLQRMLDSKRLKKVDKIDKMERDIISLQRELRRLKNDKE